MNNIQQYLQKIQEGNFATIAKCISYVENNTELGQDILKNLQGNSNTKIIGITGSPGAGKSTLTNALLQEFTDANKRVAVLSIDPSSPFNYGALLGDRIRMAAFYLNPLVYIRSLASRGALGGLHPKIIEITELLKNANFDYIIIETVGVGQSEVDIAGLADTTLVLVVPEGGDEVQTMKAGVMEIADIFIVNKCDRPQANSFVKNLNLLVHNIAADAWQVPVIKCIATQHIGITQIVESINQHATFNKNNSEQKILLYSNKIIQLLVQNKMKDINKQQIQEVVTSHLQNNTFNLLQIAQQFY